jgi:hypothetical protein
MKIKLHFLTLTTGGITILKTRLNPVAFIETTNPLDDSFCYPMAEALFLKADLS